MAKPVAISRLRGASEPEAQADPRRGGQGDEQRDDDERDDGAPSPTMEPTESENPRRTTPTRRSFLVADLQPGVAASGTRPRLATRAPAAPPR